MCGRTNEQNDLRTLFPIYDRGSKPLVVVEQLKEELEGMVRKCEDIPYIAFVSGPSMNLRVEFNDYDGDRHKPLIAEGLMCLIDRGATRIVIVAEIWIGDQDGSRTWHGVMVVEATEDGDTSHTAPFEGKNQLGGWKSGPAGETGNLSRLFARAHEREA
jgi:hypothetical protein